MKEIILRREGNAVECVCGVWGVIETVCNFPYNLVKLPKRFHQREKLFKCFSGNLGSVISCYDVKHLRCVEKCPESGKVLAAMEKMTGF